MRTVQPKCAELLAEIIRDERRKKGIRQVELARQLRQKQNWISRLEAAQRRIGVCEFLVLADAIGFDPHPIIDRLLDEGMPAGVRRRLEAAE
jgi:HTH-type transcriptional regulator/antitoxin HipB